MDMLDMIAERKAGDTKFISKLQGMKHKEKEICRRDKDSMAAAKNNHQSHGQPKPRMSNEPASTNADDSAMDMVTECKVGAAKGSTSGGRNRPKHRRHKSRKKRTGRSQDK
ncbi:hypothetical protein GGI25_004809 [Coemansia spiralis]|uniref:Uncharacterized protein n=2 Tax=Coemansia TaxID=4863 RepID=A0A9W8KWA6_9FUNG|nr:hypothetical protein EDC05_004788 [Coemansia umbellata]KAJ2620263.1 hypothetical protein GGI26_005152 [Coemansia sp. RSA 1358]KAJ2673215.1 hypothetical protein GGI25_004809 [Coemansia spiralis]